MYRRRISWTNFTGEVQFDSPCVLAKQIAQLVLSARRDRSSTVGVIFEDVVHVDQEAILFELIKVYVFETSDQQHFANSVRFSPSKRHVIVNVVDVHPNKTRNYFTRKAADCANIPLEVVQTATNLSVSYNVGVVKEGDIWYPPSFVALSESQLPLLQLLTIIFTNERIFPVVSEDQEGRLKLLPFNPTSGTILVAKLYENYLLQSAEPVPAV